MITSMVLVTKTLVMLMSISIIMRMVVIACDGPDSGKLAILRKTMAAAGLMGKKNPEQAEEEDEELFDGDDDDDDE